METTGIVIIALLICFVWIGYAYYLYVFRYDELSDMFQQYMVRLWGGPSLFPISVRSSPVLDTIPIVDPEKRKPEVFNIDNNIFTYEEAQLACEAYGAKLATEKQVRDAYKKGANWCNYGWTEGQTAFYPVQKDYVSGLKSEKEKKRCGGGKEGIVGGLFKDKQLRFGANCYGIRPQPHRQKINYAVRSPLSVAHKKLVEKVKQAKEAESSKVASYREMIQKGQIDVQPFNPSKWSEYSTRYSTYRIYPDRYTEIQVEQPTVSSEQFI